MDHYALTGGFMCATIWACARKPQMSAAGGRWLSEREEDNVESPLSAAVAVQRAKLGLLGSVVTMPATSLTDGGDTDPPLAVQFDRHDSDSVSFALQQCPFECEDEC